MRAKVWTQNGQYTEDVKNTAVMWNKGYCMYNTDLAYYDRPVADHAASLLSGGMNHDATNAGCADSASTITGSAPNWGGRLLNNSVACINSHGHVDIFWDGPNLNYVRYGDVSSAVNAKAGVQFPPRYNFAFLKACYSANNPNLFTAFQSTSFLGWTGVTWSSAEYRDWSKYFWDALRDQNTVLQARVWAHTNQSGITGDVILGTRGYRVHFVTPSLI